MNILVNGKRREVASTELQSLLDELGYGGAVIATALNGEFVPIDARSISGVTEGDRLDIVAPMQGG